MRGIPVTVFAAIFGFCTGSALHEKMTVLQDSNVTNREVVVVVPWKDTEDDETGQDDDVFAEILEFCTRCIIVLQDPNETNRKVGVVTLKDEQEDRFQCQMFTDQKLIQEMLKSSEGAYRLHRSTKEEMEEIKEECHYLSLTRRRRQAKSSWFRIAPGTKWCGAGDIAKNDDDLGTAYETDRCCRDHDKCDDYIVAGETRHNLTNRSKITKLNCKCDKEFYDCLTRVNSWFSILNRNIYFNLLRTPCYEKDYPRGKECVTSKSKITCLEYERDSNSPKVYQWTSTINYKHLPLPGSLNITFRLKPEVLRKVNP